jgi:hypothetical protein
MHDLLRAIIAIDLTPRLATLPRKPGYTTPALRGVENGITLHYGGHDATTNRSRATEIERLVSYAKHHLQLVWDHDKDGRPIYGDSIMYDLAVLSDGAIVLLRPDRRKLWHCGNKDGNATSWAVIVPLGVGQDLTEPQRTSLFRLFDVLRQISGIARRNVVGHNEWPRTSGAAIPQTSYRVVKPQSACPGPVLHRHLVAYRAQGDAVLPLPGEAIPLPPFPALDLPDYDAASPLLGPPRGTVEQAIAFITARATQYDAPSVRLIVNAYASIGTEAGVDWFLALAQMAHETGALTSWWCARPRRNPAGLGVTGATRPGPADPKDRPGPAPGSAWIYDTDRNLWLEGLVFASWVEHAIPAHLGRLIAYARRDEDLQPGPAWPEAINRQRRIQQRLADYALQLRPLPAHFRGVAPVVGELNARWAYPGPDYGTVKIPAMANAMRRMKV